MSICKCGHGRIDHTKFGGGPCEHWFRGPDGRGVRVNGPNSAVKRCGCQRYEAEARS